MIKTILSMYVTLLPAILAGILNMIWCKAPILTKINIPIDRKKCCCDGKRIFGDHKTWKGFVGYLVLNTVTAILWGEICRRTSLNSYNFFYTTYENTMILNTLIGILLGLGYALFELPNSFLKRRLDIEPGKSTQGVQKCLFIFLDQVDSVFGCCLVVCFFYKMSVPFYLQYVLLGAFTHILCNLLLYFMHLRKNMF